MPIKFMLKIKFYEKSIYRLFSSVFYVIKLLKLIKDSPVNIPTQPFYFLVKNCKDLSLWTDFS